MSAGIGQRPMTSPSMSESPNAGPSQTENMSQPERTKARKPTDIAVLLREAGLRPTRQRIALGELLFRGEDRHVTAEALHEEALSHGIAVSLATVYNTLHQFTGAGLLRELAVEGARTYFDTNVSDHAHYYSQTDGRVIDVASDSLVIAKLPPAPPGMRIARVDVTIRLEPEDGQRAAPAPLSAQSGDDETAN